ncbi:S8 family peptidase [Bacillus sp. FJAT-45350]|uniref:S8 family peptidase n=1 Tax=Bacillus sp. FJAT-45350 TaxID=2011014 RepID=UPI000BB9A871|nr:S8 family peptidase [Bacillus sp. FJAT-45350]
MRKTYRAALFVGAFIVLGFVALLLNNADNMGLQNHTQQEQNLERMDQVLANDLSMTTSMFIDQLSLQLHRWAEQDLTEPMLREQFAQEIDEHKHFHGFAMVENNEIKESIGDITSDKLALLTHNHESKQFSDPYVMNGHQFLLMSENIDSSKKVVGEIDLSFVKTFVHNMASVADANGNFFISGEDPEVKWETADRIPDDVATETVPELGWNIVVHSKPSEDEEKDYHEGEAVVKFEDEADAKNWVQGQDDLQVLKDGGPYVVLRSDTRTTQELLRELRRDNRVEVAEPNYIISKQTTTNARIQDKESLPNDEFFQEYQWNLSQISAEEGWNLTEGAEDVIIAVLDTGVDPDHQDLSGKLLPGYNAFDGTSNSYDEHGHGTHVAGIAAAITNNVTGIAGVSWHNFILPIKVLDEDGQGTSFEVARGIRWATDNGAKVINMSLGDYYNSFILHDAIRYAHKNDVVLIAASGNDNVNTPMYPSDYPEVLTVAAVDHNRERAFFSNFGPHIDVAAPGEHIPSTFPDNNYVIMSGTSMAAPHVAGLAGLIRSLNPNLTKAEVHNLIRETSLDLGPTGHDQYYGFGEIDVARALEKLR